MFPPVAGHTKRYVIIPNPVNISVIIPAFNEEKLLPETLRCVKNAGAAWDRLGWSWELVVCDNNSTDGTPQIAEAHDAKVVFEPENQISRARNAGASAATGDWLLFIDADSRPTWKHFEQVRRCVESGRHLGGGTNIQLDPTEFWADVLQWGWNTVSRCLNLPAGSFFFCSREAFHHVGGFPETVYASEELHLGIALNRESRRRGLSPLHIIRHPAMITSGRKLHLYTAGEHLRFFAKSLSGRMSSLADREHCHLWYDGRR